MFKFSRGSIKARLSRSQCIYCGSKATTRDHVPPRLLLTRPYPPNLLTVPSCKACNNDASIDEQYFLALISHISSSPALETKLAPEGEIDRMFSYSPLLEERLLNALKIDKKTGKPVIQIEVHRVNSIVKKIAIGLFALQYGLVPLGSQIEHVALYPYKPTDQRPVPYFLATFTERFKTKRWRSVQPTAFEYIFVRDPINNGKVICIMDIYQSVWGVVHLPNPKSAKPQIMDQLSLFTETKISRHSRV